MDFGLQMGHGMQSLVLEYLGSQGTSNPLILSPRNFGKTKNKTGFERMASFSNGPVRKMSKCILVDPQLFSGVNATASLRDFPHWKVCAGSIRNNPDAVLYEVGKMNEACATDELIIPSHTIEKVEYNHLRHMREYAASARRVAGYRKTIMTLSFDQDVLRDTDSVNMLLCTIEDWDVDGFYVVSEHPRNEYLVDQPLWLYNYMGLIAGIKRMGKIAYAGYGSHQLLLLALAGCDCLFSGNYLNVRRFERNTFEEREEGASQRTCWYYAPQALSEFKVTTLDLAHSLQALETLRSPFDDEEYVGMLFRGALPSDTAYDERKSFMHYLICLDRQCRLFSKDTYEKTRSSLNSSFCTAQSLIEGLQEIGIGDKARSFASALPAAFQAIAAFHATWGFQMSQEWQSFQR